MACWCSPASVALQRTGRRPTLLLAAVTWAEQHPPESIDEAATWITAAGDTGLPLAGEGAPLVSEFCIAEFALAIGRSTDAGRAHDRGSGGAEVPTPAGVGAGAGR